MYCGQRSITPQGRPRKTFILHKCEGAAVKSVTKIISASAFLLSTGVPALAYETEMEYQIRVSAITTHAVQHVMSKHTRPHRIIRANAYAPANPPADSPSGVNFGISSQR
jgi:hypothetical protein